MANDELGWQQAFSAWERAIGAPLEDFVQTEQFADALAAFVRQQSEFGTDLSGAVERWLRLWNLPTMSDVRGLQEQLQQLEQEVGRLRSELRRREATSGPTADSEP